MTSTPTLTIAIPTYNRAGSLGAAIDSVLAQPLDACELLVNDNASTDHTAAVLAERDHPALRVETESSTVSMYANHNRCMQKARGRHLMYLHSDDVLTDGAVQRVLTYLETLGAPDVLQPALPKHEASAPGETLDLHGPSGLASLYRWSAAAPTGATFRVESALRLPFREDLLAADLDFLLRLLERGGRLVVVPDRIVAIDRGAQQATHAWKRSGRFTSEVSGIVCEHLHHDGAIEAVLADVPRWSALEIAVFLVYTAHGGRMDVVDAVERAVAPRTDYRRLPHYRQIRVARLMGSAGLRVTYRMLKRLARSRG